MEKSEAFKKPSLRDLMALPTGAKLLAIATMLASMEDDAKKLHAMAESLTHESKQLFVFDHDRRYAVLARDESEAQMILKEKYPNLPLMLPMIAAKYADDIFGV